MGIVKLIRHLATNILKLSLHALAETCGVLFQPRIATRRCDLGGFIDLGDEVESYLGTFLWTKPNVTGETIGEKSVSTKREDFLLGIRRHRAIKFVLSTVGRNYESVTGK